MKPALDVSHNPYYPMKKPPLAALCRRMATAKAAVKAAVATTLLCILPQNTAAQSYTFANYQKYAEANKALGKPSKKDKRVVFLGNSITEHWAAKRPEYFKTHGYIGRGISGQTSYQLLLRFREDVIMLQPTVVVIGIGTNDIAENTGKYVEDYTFGNIVSMVELAKSNHIKPVLAALLPAKDIPWRPDLKGIMGKIRSLNARLQAYAKAQRIPYIDYFTPLLAPDGSGMDGRYTPESVHPNEAGYAVMEAIVTPVVEKLR